MKKQPGAKVIHEEINMKHESKCVYACVRACVRTCVYKVNKVKRNDSGMTLIRGRNE